MDLIDAEADRFLAPWTIDGLRALLADFSLARSAAYGRMQPSVIESIMPIAAKTAI